MAEIKHHPHHPDIAKANPTVKILLALAEVAGAGAVAAFLDQQYNGGRFLAWLGDQFPHAGVATPPLVDINATRAALIQEHDATSTAVAPSGFEVATVKPTGVVELTATQVSPTEAPPTATPDGAVEMRTKLEQAGIVFAQNTYDPEVLKAIVSGQDIDVKSLKETFSVSYSPESTLNLRGVDARALGSFAVLQPGTRNALICTWVAVRETGSNPRVSDKKYSNTRFVPVLDAVVIPAQDGMRMRFLSLVGYVPSGEWNARPFEGYQELSDQLRAGKEVWFGIIDRYNIHGKWAAYDSGIDYFVQNRIQAAKIVIPGTYVDEISGTAGSLPPRGIYDLALSRGEPVIGFGVSIP